MIHCANSVHRAIRIACAFDTGAFAVANHRPHRAFRARRERFVFAFARGAARIHRAFLTIIGDIGRIDDPIDAISRSIALIDFAITHDLFEHRRAFGRQIHSAKIGFAETQTAFRIRSRTFTGRETWRLRRFIEARINAEIIDAIDEMTGGDDPKSREKKGPGPKKKGQFLDVPPFHQNFPRMPNSPKPTIGST